MATLLTAIEYTSPDPNNILEAREINGGEGIKVAVVDLYFPEFLDMRVADFANTDIEVSSDNLPSVDSASTVFGANNSMHGTVVASRVGGQIGGAAPHVAISAIGIGAESVVDVSSGSFTVDVEARINAMESVMESSDIIVVSLASTEVSEVERVAYTRLFAEGKAKGKFFVLGAGNEARHLNSEMQAVGRLAENSHVLVVGGTDTTGEITTLAGEVYAHDGGDSIVPLWTSGWVPTDSDSGNKFVNDNYTQLVEGGSSFSAPVVAGVLANMLAMDPSLRQRPEDVERILKDTSGDFGIDAVAALRLTYREMLAKHPKMPFRGR
jgi:hypothetical protein